MLGSRGDGPPVYTYEAVPGVPPVSVLRFPGGELPPGAPQDGSAHSHDFLVLAYFEHGGGSVGFEGVEGWTVSFPPEVLGGRAPGAFLSWRAHPLLFPFVGGPAGGAQRLKVPAGDRPSWSGRFSALDVELRRRRDGYREAVLAHLTLLLVEVSRLAADVVRDLRLKDEPLLAEVFGFIEERYGERVSLKDVARAVGLTPGYLTTVVGRKTGRTVVEWISERRMAEARRLLVETDLSVEEVGHNVGYGNPSYFVRHFRRAHGSTPLGWRRAGRP
jgi:AraC family transcriptional activator of pobA